MGVEIARLLLVATVAVTVTACDAGDKGNAAPPQASGALSGPQASGALSGPQASGALSGPQASGALSGPQASGFGAAASAATPPAINSIDRSHAGTPAPKVVFEKRGGGKTSLADFRGQRVLVNLWATWCAPCIAEMPDLDRMAAAKTGKLLVLPLSQDMEGWKAVNGFFKPGKFKTLVPMLDQPGSFAEALKARGLPMSVLYDARGREVWRVAGTLKWGSPEVLAAL
jgi:thiol-disulfide isomerase/thioredoxin